MKGLDDLCVRFIINLPLEELSTPERICFQIEEAQWFYEDFIRPTDPDLPSLNLRNFTIIMFQHCPLLKGWSSEQQTQAFQAFLDYKTTVPVRGAIMLNQDMDEVVLVRGWKKGSNWSFPRGKIDQNEEDLKCAVREVYEETGYDLKASGLVGEERDVKFIDLQIRGQELKMYIFRGIPVDTHFEPRTRKEISKIQWHKLSDLPTAKAKKQQQQQGYGEELAVNANKYYMVAPFLGPLKKWIGQQKKRDRAMSASQAKGLAYTYPTNVETAALEQESMDERLDDERVQQDHLARLLHTLRQSSQVKNNPLPEVSHPPEAQQSGPNTSTKSANLLALLRGNAGDVAEQKPHTPINQIVEEPTRPKSPSHPPVSRQTSNLPPPAFTTYAPQPPPLDHDKVLDSYHHRGSSPRVLPQPPQVRSIPQPTQPAQLAPRGSSLHPSMPSDRKTQPSHQHPTKHFPPGPFSSLGRQGPAAPSASNLPLPKLNPQSSALLSLFKESSATKDRTSEEQAQGKPASAPSKQQDQNSPIRLVPPQVTRRPSEKVPQSDKPRAVHQANLLDILRGPSAPKDLVKSLEPPETAVELSASPSPGRSRKHSNIEKPAKTTPVPNDEKTFGSVKIQKRSNRTNPALSATVNGPLNVPQFDMIRVSSREAQATAQKTSKNQADAPSIKILSRPSSSHAIPVTPNSAPAPHVPHQPVHQKGQPVSLITPTNIPQPPTPDLKAQNAPPKSFQPQILRRSGIPSDINELSPIQPLPSPKHKSTAAQNHAPQDNHKKSLLSLFTKPSPAVSPPSVTADNSLDPNSLISPLEKSATSSIPQIGGQPNDVFASPKAVAATNSIPAAKPNPSKEEKKFYAPDRMPLPSSKKKNDVVATSLNNGRTSGPSSGRHTPVQPQTATTNPVQKEFLLGYLADVVKSGR